MPSFNLTLEPAFTPTLNLQGEGGALVLELATLLRGEQGPAYPSEAAQAATEAARDAALAAQGDAEAAQAASEAARDAAAASAAAASGSAGTASAAAGSASASAVTASDAAGTATTKAAEAAASAATATTKAAEAAASAASVALGIPGAAGDGATIDSVAIQEAITAAGVGGKITFQPGKTYLIDRTLYLLQGQTVHGHGATIKRVGQVITTTNTTITSGTTNVLTVASGAGANFRVGQTLGVYQSGKWSTAYCKILSIVGDDITLNASFSLSSGSRWSGTTTVALQFDSFRPAKNCTVLGLTIDGNSADWSYYRWETCSEFHWGASGVVIDGCTLRDLPGEGIQESAYAGTTTSTAIASGVTTAITVATGQGSLFSVGDAVTMQNGAYRTFPKCRIASIAGDVLTFDRPIIIQAGAGWSGTTTVYGVIEGCKYLNNRIVNANGNGIHFSGSDGTLVSGNHIDRTNLQGTAMGHDGGCITFSTAIADVRIVGNVLSNGRCGVGQMNGNSAMSVVIDSNQIINPTTYGIEAINATPNDSCADITITNNYYFSDRLSAGNTCIPFASIQATGGAASVYPSRITIAGNAIRYACAPSSLATSIYIYRAVDVAVCGNVLAFLAGDVKSAGIGLDAVSAIAVTGNVISGGNQAMTLGASYALSNAVLEANSLRDQSNYGAYFGGGSNVLFSGNTVTNQATANSNYRGILAAGAGLVVKNNVFQILAGSSCVTINGVANCVVQGNTAHAHGSGKTIRVETGSTGYVVTENQVNYAIVDTPAVGVRVANNDVIA